MTWLRNLLQAAYNLDPAQRKVVVLLGTVVSAIFTCALIAGAFHAAVLLVPAESPMWEAALQSRLILVRLAVAPAIAMVAVIFALLFNLVFGKTETARRLFTWAPTDTEQVRAEKVRNSGNFLAVIMGALILGMLFGVLR